MSGPTQYLSPMDQPFLAYIGNKQPDRQAKYSHLFHVKFTPECFAVVQPSSLPCNLSQPEKENI